MYFYLIKVRKRKSYKGDSNHKYCTKKSTNNRPYFFKIFLTALQNRGIYIMLLEISLQLTERVEHHRGTGDRMDESPCKPTVWAHYSKGVGAPFLRFRYPDEHGIPIRWEGLLTSYLYLVKKRRQTHGKKISLHRKNQRCICA